MGGKNSDPVIAQLFSEAIELRDAGDFPGAIKKLNEACALASEPSAVILAVLGYAHYQQKAYESARECLMKVVELSPDSELGSLSLFHTLWDMGREWEAFREAKRFLSRHDSKEYFQMIEEMRDAFLDAGIDVKPSKDWRTGH